MHGMWQRKSHKVRQMVEKSRRTDRSVSDVTPLTQTFLKEYDNGELYFPVLYRKGAPITCRFGIAEGYRVVDGEAIWDSVRLHTGVDRGATNKAKENVVYTPFDFDRSEFHHYGSNHVYGSMIRLFNETYGFEMRIIHMNPESDISSNVLPLLESGKGLPRNTLLGKAGNYGFSYGAHTHTEIVSVDEKSTVLDEVLWLQYGMNAGVSYEEDRSAICDMYREFEYWQAKSDNQIFAHFMDQLEKRRVVGTVNDYKMEFKDWYSNYLIRTRYSSARLFNGM